ncbi:unnamed protein product [marine sediment metagenome]|uniref:Uncharacterized protein n=1 Tax=marine sediment metagenome TaxID=412755 RepID=X1JYS4_9ZZZZ
MPKINPFNPAMRRIIEADMLQIPRVLVQGERIAEAVESQQLSLF